MTLTIVIPVYNNAGSLDLLFEDLQHLQEQLKTKGYVLKVIFIDDASVDESWKVLKSLQQDFSTFSVLLIKLRQNYGAVLTSFTGIVLADSDFTAVLAADRQERAENILNMLVTLENSQANIVVGTRTQRYDSRKDKLASFLFMALIRIFIKKLPNKGFDLCLFDKLTKAKLIDSYNGRSFWSYHLFTLTGLSISEYPIIRHKRGDGKSQWTFQKKIQAVFNNIYPFLKNSRFLYIICLFFTLITLFFGYCSILYLDKNKPWIFIFFAILGAEFFIYQFYLLLKKQYDIISLKTEIEEIIH